MLALILAGGEGSRLGLGEKPLVDICGKPMVAWVIDAFTGAGLEVAVVASSRTPMTLNYLRAQGIPFYRAQGRGYVEDIVEAVTTLEVSAPLFTSVADIPCLRPDHVKKIREAYLSQEKPALSSWIPRDLCPVGGCRTGYTEMVDGVPSAPAGVNVLLGERIREPQEEHRLLLHDPALAWNVNTPEELEAVRRVVCGGRFRETKLRETDLEQPAIRRGATRMRKRKIAVTPLDGPIEELVGKTDQKTLAIWAADCASRVLPHFEEKYPGDTRPRNAIEALREWVSTGMFRMADVRRTALAAHAAARDVQDDDAARSAARAAGQAMATAHVPRHALAAAMYAATAVRDAADPAESDNATIREREWQYRHLLGLMETDIP
ncbi:MAG TPA: NTP transferase domain-containing protein [Methanomicrobiales archaeon]|nr:NTP transferase domain-containing protein [Methanomicrobiales archaeon]